jgi:hypothetical protein
MFETAARFRKQIQKDVFPVGQRTPHGVVALNDLLKRCHRARSVPDAFLTQIREIVRNTIDVETIDSGVSGEDRRIDQAIVIGRDVMAPASVAGFVEAGDAGGP